MLITMSSWSDRVLAKLQRPSDDEGCVSPAAVGSIGDADNSDEKASVIHRQNSLRPTAILALRSSKARREAIVALSALWRDTDIRGSTPSATPHRDITIRVYKLSYGSV